LNVTVTVRFPVSVRVQGFVLTDESHPVQLPNVDGAIGVAVSVIGVPLANPCVTHGPGLVQLKPGGLLVTVPVPNPWKVRVNAGLPLPPPEPVKQTTFPVMYPVTIAPDEDNPPMLVLVVRVAETRVPPQVIPVTARRPVGSTVII
jgi:hypothetical protein